MVSVNRESPPAPPKQEEHKYKEQLQEITSFFKTLLIFLVAAFVLRASVVEAFKIPSGSMIPTLKIGDHILVSKFAYGLRVPLVTKVVYQFSQPQRGDIVVFTRPDDPTTVSEDESSINIIKRVIGLPGDKIEVQGMKVYINGEEYKETNYFVQYLENGIREGAFPQGGDSNTVPAGKVFLMGDNRDHSKDSRFWDDPFLPIDRIKGKALIIYWTWDSEFFQRIGKIIR